MPALHADNSPFVHSAQILPLNLASGVNLSNRHFIVDGLLKKISMLMREIVRDFRIAENGTFPPSGVLRQTIRVNEYSSGSP